MIVKKGEIYACEGAGFNNTAFYGIQDDDEFGFMSGQVSVKVIVADRVVNAQSIPGPTVTNVMSTNQKLLQEDLEWGVTIIPRNGNPVKCHKCFLTALSPCIHAMFQSDTKESKTLTIEMPDTSEEGVRAMLAYLYYWDESKAGSKASVAFEAMIAGRKYVIPLLETAMKKLLLGGPDGWFENDMDTVLGIFLFTKSLPIDDGDDLKMRAVRAAKR